MFTQIMLLCWNAAPAHRPTMADVFNLLVAQIDQDVQAAPFEKKYDPLLRQNLNSVVDSIVANAALTPSLSSRDPSTQAFSIETPHAYVGVSLATLGSKFTSISSNGSLSPITAANAYTTMTFVSIAPPPATIITTTNIITEGENSCSPEGNSPVGEVTHSKLVHQSSITKSPLMQAPVAEDEQQPHTSRGLKNVDTSFV